MTYEKSFRRKKLQVTATAVVAASNIQIAIGKIVIVMGKIDDQRR